MERKNRVWRRTPYRLIWYLAVLAGAFLLLQGYRKIYKEEREPGVFIVEDQAEAGKELTLDAVHIYNRNVAECAWYVDETQVQSGTKLVGYTPSEEDVEKLIRVQVTLKDGTVYGDYRYYSVLPVLYLECDTAYEAVEKETESPVQVRLTGKGYTPTELYDGEGTIHLRGNSTAELDKRPFKLRLAKKRTLLGMEKSRHWVLLANAIDTTLMRNELANNLSAALGADCYMDSRQVTLVYNGSYCGVYQLCEQIRIAENRVGVYNWKNICDEAAEEIAQSLKIEEKEKALYRKGFEKVVEQELLADFSWMDTGVFISKGLEDWNEQYGTSYPTKFRLADYIDFSGLPDPTGGVLLNIDARNTDSSLETAYHLPIEFADPVAGATGKKLYENIKTQIQTLEYAFHSTDFTYRDADPHYRVTDEGYCNYSNHFAREGVEYEETAYSDPERDGSHYSELMDLNSLLENFLLCEFTMNWDAMKNSVYFYKDLDGPWYLEPAWDYDWGWGNSMYTLNTWYTDEWQTTSDYYANETYYQTVQWNRYLIRDPYFLVLLQEKYQEARETILEEYVKDGGLIDQYAEMLRPAAEANGARWGGSMGTFEGQKFGEGVQELKRFMKERLAWLDQQFVSVETLRKSLGYYVTSDELTISRPRQDALTGAVTLTVRTEIEDCKSVSLQVNGTWFYTERLKDGQAAFEIPVEALRGAGERNVVQARLLEADGSYRMNPEGTQGGDYANAVSAYTWFTGIQ